MKRKNSTFTLIFIFLVCYICYMCNYLLRQVFSTSQVALVEQSILTTAQIGIIGNVFFWTYAVFRFIAGPVCDRFSPNIIVGAGLFVIAASAFLFSRFYGFLPCAVLWGVNAAGQAFLWGAMLRILSKNMPKEKMPTVLSMFTTCLIVGLVLAIIVCPFLEQISGGPALSFVVSAVLCAVMAVIIFLMPQAKIPTVKAEKITVASDSVSTDASLNSDAPAETTAATATTATSKPSLADLLKDKNFTKLFFPDFIHGILKENVPLWMSAYFVARFAIDLKKSIIFVILIPLIGMLGRIFFPFFYKLFKKDEHRIQTFATAICIVGVLFPLFVPAGTGTILWPLLAAVGLGLANMMVNTLNQIYLSQVPIRYADLGLSARASGIMDLVSYCGAGIGSLVYGFLLEKVDFFYMFLSWVILLGASLVYLLLTTPKRAER